MDEPILSPILHICLELYPFILSSISYLAPSYILYYVSKSDRVKYFTLFDLRTSVKIQLLLWFLMNLYDFFSNYMKEVVDT